MYLSHGGEARVYLQVIKVVRKSSLRLPLSEWLQIKHPSLSSIRLIKETNKYITYTQDYLPIKCTLKDRIGLMEASYGLFLDGWWLYDINLKNWHKRNIDAVPQLVDYHPIRKYTSQKESYFYQNPILEMFLANWIMWSTNTVLPIRGNVLDNLVLPAKIYNIVKDIIKQKMLSDTLPYFYQLLTLSKETVNV